MGAAFRPPEVLHRVRKGKRKSKLLLALFKPQHGYMFLSATASPFSTFDSQLLSFHILIDSASVSPFGAHTSKKSHIYIKTIGFKPFRDTYLQSAISQSLLNHILPKNCVRGWVPLSICRQS